MRSEDDTDYITLMPCTDFKRHLVIVMRWSDPQDGFVQTRCSQPLSEMRARALSIEWATRYGLEVR